MPKLAVTDTARQHLAERVRASLGPDPRLTEKHMFGSLAFLLNGHILAGVRKDGTMLLSVGKAGDAAALAHPGVTPMIMRERVMKGFVQLDTEAIESDDALQFWLSTAERHVSTLPPK